MMHYILFIMHLAVCIKEHAPSIINIILCTFHFALCTSSCTLCSLCYTLCNMWYAFFAIYNGKKQNVLHDALYMLCYKPCNSGHGLLDRFFIETHTRYAKNLTNPLVRRKTLTKCREMSVATIVLHLLTICHMV